MSAPGQTGQKLEMGKTNNGEEGIWPRHKCVLPVKLLELRLMMVCGERAAKRKIECCTMSLLRLSGMEFPLQWAGGGETAAN